MSVSPSTKRYIQLLTGPHAGERHIAIATSEQVLYVPEINTHLTNKNYRSWNTNKIADDVKPGDEYEDLFGAFDGRGDLITIGSEILYSKDKQVRIGTVAGFGKRNGGHTRKLQIREHEDVRDYDWKRAGGLFLVNDSWDCLLIRP